MKLKSAIKYLESNRYLEVIIDGRVSVSSNVGYLKDCVKMNDPRVELEVTKIGAKVIGQLTRCSDWEYVIQCKSK